MGWSAAMMGVAGSALRPGPASAQPGDLDRPVEFPASDRAFWRAPKGPESLLQYLAWGTLQDGEGALAESHHDGWTYVVVESGSPTLVHGGRRERLDGLTLIILGPDCDHGWEDASPRAGKLLVWRWRQPVQEALRRLRRDAVVRLGLDAGEVAELRHLHALTRNEVFRGDRHSGAALAGIQGLIEARIARLGEGACDSRKEAIDRALGWIKAHLTTRQPLARLADFLGVSPATVQRLFRERLGTTVMKSIAEIRRREAERMLLLQGATIKEVAYTLGYRHPHDFSRAFRNHTGRLPPRHLPALENNPCGRAPRPVAA